MSFLNNFLCRQEGDRDYADFLNRTRLGEHTEDDLSKLQARVRPEGHPDMKNALVVAATHEIVNKHNDLILGQMSSGSTIETSEATHSHSIIANFKPTIDPKKRTVGPTPYLQSLPIVLGSRVMLTINLDVTDMLSNGSLGTLRGVLRDKSTGEPVILMVQFDMDDSGKKLQGRHPNLAKSFPGCTPILKQTHKYTTAKHSKGARAELATVCQHPLVPSEGVTGHKIQGQTVKAPRTIAVHLNSIFGPNQAYVMLGRVENQEQLFIIDSLPDNKIYCDPAAKEQLEVMRGRSENNNPPVWQRSTAEGLRIAYLNICSLRPKMDDLKVDPILAFADIIFLGETWLEEGTNVTAGDLQLEGYNLHTINVGRGKGLAAYYKRGKATLARDIIQEDLQISVLSSANTTIIGVYRSRNNVNLPEILQEIIPKDSDCVVMGDFNICYHSTPNDPGIQTLKTNGFQELISRPTHILGGCIDMVWTRIKNKRPVAQTYSPIYTCKDHDCLLLGLYASDLISRGIKILI